MRCFNESIEYRKRYFVNVVCHIAATVSCDVENNYTVRRLLFAKRPSRRLSRANHTFSDRVSQLEKKNTNKLALLALEGRAWTAETLFRIFRKTQPEPGILFYIPSRRSLYNIDSPLPAVAHKRVGRFLYFHNGFCFSSTRPHPRTTYATAALEYFVHR